MADLVDAGPPDPRRNPLWVWKNRTPQPVDLNQPMWLGWRRWTWVRLAFAVMVAQSMFGFYQTDRISDDRVDDAKALALDLAQRTADEQYDTCLQRNEFRTIVSNIVILSTEGRTVDLTGVEGFDLLSEETQKFLLNLREETAANDGADNPMSFRNKALAELALADCEAEHPEASVLENEQ